MNDTKSLTRWPTSGRAGPIRGFTSRRLKGLAAPGYDRTFRVLVAWLVVVFLFGGGSRADIASLMILRPVSVLVLAYGLAGLKAEHVRANRFLFAMAAAWIVLLLAHLLPLPPAVWRALPGRDIVEEIDRAAGLGEVWRPLTMVPYATRNALWAMVAPLAVLVLGVQLDARQRFRLLPLVLALGLLSALVAVLQILGDPRGPLYFYHITNHGSAVGLFANRNHQAIFLATLLPMLAVWVRTRSEGERATGRARRWTHRTPIVAGAGILVALFVLLLILVTGSRAGMIMALVALLLLPAVLAGGRRGEASGWKVTAWLLPLGVVALVGVTILLDRALAVERFLSSETAEDMRIRILPTLLRMIDTYAPFGSGIGTFEQVYKLHEPDGLLATFYMNHAHNDWLELALTGGVPALLLAAVAAAAFLLALVRLAAASADRQAVRFGRLGLGIILIFALASLSDYPLRVPALACLAVVAALWIGAGRLSPKAGPDASC
jgi:O-antigen ligase